MTKTTRQEFSTGHTMVPPIVHAKKQGAPHSVTQASGQFGELRLLLGYYL